MIQLIIQTIVGAIAFRGACSLVYARSHGSALNIPLAFAEGKMQKLVTLYMFAALPLAFANGFLYHFSWIQALIVMMSTWLGMLISNIVLRFNPAIQFMFFGLVNIIWLIINVLRTIFW
jgi:hypothetical protein